MTEAAISSVADINGAKMILSKFRLTGSGRFLKNLTLPKMCLNINTASPFQEG